MRPNLVAVFACTLIVAAGIGVVGAGTAFSQSGQIVGRVSDRDGPAPGVQVTAQPMEPGLPATTFTASDGTYRLSSLRPGQYQVLFALNGFTTRIFEHVRVPRTPPLDAVIWLESSGEPINWSASFDAGGLKGRTVDKFGRPIVGACIALTGRAVPAEHAVLQNGWPAVESGMDGRFVIEPPLPVGTYHLRVAAAGFALMDVPVEISLNHVTDLNVTMQPFVPPRPADALVGSVALLLETADGASAMELVASDLPARAEFLADIDTHQLDHPYALLTDADFADAQRRSTRRWQWRLASPSEASVRATNQPYEPVTLRLATPFPTRSPFPGRILAVSRLKDPAALLKASRNQLVRGPLDSWTPGALRPAARTP